MPAADRDRPDDPATAIRPSASPDARPCGVHREDRRRGRRPKARLLRLAVGGPAVFTLADVRRLRERKRGKS